MQPDIVSRSLSEKHEKTFNSETIFFSDEPFSELKLREEIKSPPHIRETTEVKFVLSGKADFLIENRAVEVNRGEILIIENFVVHSLMEREPAVICTLSLSAEGERSRLIKKPFIGGFMKISPESTGETDRVFGLLPYLLLEGERKSSYSLMKAAAYVILGILENEEIIEAEQTQEPKSEVLDRIEKVKEYVKLHSGEEITVASAAEILGVCPAYFCRLFKKETGGTFVSFVNSYRIEQARKKLLQTDISITDIMYEAGFSNYGYFNRIFKKYTGLSPSEYRRKR